MSVEQMPWFPQSGVPGQSAGNFSESNDLSYEWNNQSLAIPFDIGSMENCQLSHIGLYLSSLEFQDNQLKFHRKFIEFSYLHRKHYLTILHRNRTCQLRYKYHGDCNRWKRSNQARCTRELIRSTSHDSHDLLDKSGS